MLDLWAITNVGGVPEPHPSFTLGLWQTECCDVTVDLEFDDASAVLGSRAVWTAAAAGEMESLHWGIFLPELLKVELGAIFRSGFVAEGFDVWLPPLVLFVVLSVHSTTTRKAVSQSKTFSE